MDPADHVREFAADEIPAAAAFIRTLPANARVYVDAWADGKWRFAFYDDQQFAAGSLTLLRSGQRFRVRASRGAVTPDRLPLHRDASTPSVILVPAREHQRRRWRGLRRFFKQLFR